MRVLLEQLNDKIQALERELDEMKSRLKGKTYSNPARGRGQQPRGGRGSFRPTRPTSGTTFSPTCYYCNQKGHMKKDFPS